ncbi:MAG: LON peptidase substrate-binding domain-containing protein [Pseudomonadota bacterium]
MTQTFEVALFPIPNLVAFPGTIVPLHVFEPRYRQLVRDSVRDERMVAVSHVVSTISAPKQADDLETALQSNQATYKPCRVFSAGACELKQTLEDGRILAHITMTHRLTLAQDIQTLPYRIAECHEFEDQPETDQAEANKRLQTRILAHLINLCKADSPDFAEELDSSIWRDLDPAEFSFRIFQALRLDTEFMQTLLESTSPQERLARIDQALLRV